jgi:hypothetical protein
MQFDGGTSTISGSIENDTSSPGVTGILLAGYKDAVNLDGAIINHGTLICPSDYSYPRSVFQAVGAGATLNGYGQAIVNEGNVRATYGTTLSLVGTIVNDGRIAMAWGGNAAAIRLETQVDFGGTDTAASREIEFAGHGVVSMGYAAANMISATHAGDILDNTGNTIIGNGQIGGGSAMGILNNGIIDAYGGGALVVNVATGEVTNQLHGLLEGSGTGSLSLAGGTFTNIGTVEALDGSSVAFGSGAVLTNSSAGTLTGGRWLVTDSGGTEGISLSGPKITTLAAQIDLSGAASTFRAGGVRLESSLATIAGAGKLELLAHRSWTGTVTLTDEGLLKLSGGTFAAPSLTVIFGGTLSGVGTLTAPLESDGLIKAGRGALDLTGALTGTGTAEILSQTSLEIDGAVAAAQTVLFGAGIHAVLKLGDPSGFAGTLMNWALGDTIDLLATDATSAAITGDTLAIDLQGGGTLDYNLANPPTGVRIVLSSDGAGGTDLTLYKAKAPATALLTQHMAGMTPTASSVASLAAEPASASLESFAAARPN